MTTLYKLTDSDGYTQRKDTRPCLWGAGVSHSALGTGTKLCSEDVIHAYVDPLLAVLLNPIHANFPSTMRLWRAEGEVVATDGQLKVGVKTLTVIEEIPIPHITTEQRVKFGILCALEVYKEPTFVKWANSWLDGTDRAAEAARAADLISIARKAVS